MNKQMLIVGFVAFLAASVAVGAVWFTAPADGPARSQEETGQMHTVTDYQALMAQLERDGVDTLTDTDGDGLPDAVENFLYGSDPNAFSTTGNDIPDGWFARYGYDPTRAGVEKLPAAVPPDSGLPEVYDGDWPDRYRWALADVYFYGMPENWTEETYFDNGIDPNQWRLDPDGLPTSWLAYHFPDREINETGELEILDPELPGRSLTGDGFTVRDNFEHDTDPHLVDTDGDGLSDVDEVRIHDTDPRLYSTSGTGIPDGWLVHHQLDPLDPMVGTMDPTGKGMTVKEVWEYNRERFGEADALEGEGLDPSEMSERGDAVPDGWLVAHGLDPLEEGVTEQEYQCASDYEDVRHLTSGDTPDGLEPLPDLCLGVADAYLYGRPQGWSESEDGPWSGGLDPAEGDQDGDGLPDAVEIRGWYVERTVGLGPGGESDWAHVVSDPRKADTDGDGLTDHEEYHGRAEHDGVVYVFPPTDPSNPDTAFSGMTDAEKVFAKYDGESWDLHEEEDDGSLRPLLDPTRRDTAGDYLSDGDAMGFWVQARDNVLREEQGELTYRNVYQFSEHDSYLDWINQLEWLGNQQLGYGKAAALLAPDGDVDNDGTPNVVDPFASGDNLRNGWQVDPSTLRFSDFPPATESQPRHATDPANTDTSGDRLPDEWKLRYGEWDDQIGGWDLDPAKWDSNGDGESDADGNLDGDVVVWYAYRDGERERNEWPYTNLLEQQFGTNPRVPDENNNGVTEGWAVFWGSERFYALWVREGPPEGVDLGDVVPSAGDGFTQVQQMIGNPLDEGVGTRVKDELRYYRFVEATDPNADALHLDERFDESYAEDWPQRIDVFRDGDLMERRIGWIEGTYGHTHADDQRWGLNPYLEDTTGDGVRDAWAAFYARQCNLDPAGSRLAGQEAPGRSGLTVGMEYASRTDNGDHSTNPCEADTDLDGINDGAELERLMNPVDPRDASDALEEGKDEDGDGLSDADELMMGTDPMDPDSDRDGLLDGYDLPCDPGLVDANLCLIEDHDFNEPEWEALQAFGVAHKKRECSENYPQDGPYCFFGELSRNTDPLDPYSRVDGIPDGWAAYYGRTSGGATLRMAYECSMPDWWERSLLGVWWWGLPPQPGSWDGECPRDRDFDGLDDYNGEDPVPGASQSNRAADVDLPDMMDNRSIPRLDLVRAAQSWGECAGNPHDADVGESCFDQWETEWNDNLESRFLSVKIEDAQLTPAGTDVEKEQGFTASGRLVIDDEACNDDCPVAANRTVVLRLWNNQNTGNPLHYDIARSDPMTNGVTLGVAYTNEHGEFSIPGCLCAAPGEIEVPNGMVALGHSNTSATWSAPAADVAPGSKWKLGVHVYATTATYWGDPNDPELDDKTHPHYLEVEDEPRATSSLWASIKEVRVRSDTSVRIDGPDQHAWSDAERRLTFTVELHDASGGAVAGQPVQVTMGDTQDTWTTNPQGRIALDLELGSRTGPITIQATYAGNDTLEGSTETHDLVLQAPLELELDDSGQTQAVRLGESTGFTVRAVSQGQGAQGVTVSASLGSLTESATTGGDGVATITLSVPQDLEPGPAEVRYGVSASVAYASAAAVETVSLVSGANLQAGVPELGRLGAPLVLDGRLTLADGSPIAGESVHVGISGHELGVFTTDGEGRFEGAPVVPLSVGIGDHALRVSYEGVPDVIDAVVVEKTVRFTVATVLDIDELHSGRGQQVVLEGGLTSITGHPLVGEWVNLSLPWEDSVLVQVRAGGVFEKSVLVPGNQSLGAFQWNATYEGSVNGTYGGARADASFVVGAPSRLDVEPLGVLHRGNNEVVARLMDVETGEPIAGVPVRASSPFEDDAESVATTDDEGWVRLQLTVTEDVDPGRVDMTLRFQGDARYGPAQAEVSGILRVATSLGLSVPGELGRGTQHVFEATLTDDRGVGLADRNVSFDALGTTWNVTTDASGKVNTTFDLPLEASLGEGQVRASWPGDEAHNAVRVDRDVVVKDGVHVRVDGVPDEVRPGDRITLAIVVEDTAGNPVQTTLVVRIDGVPGSILVETDEEGHAEVNLVVPEGLSDTFRLSVRFPGTDELAARTEVFEPRFMTASTGEPEEGSGRLWLALTAGVSAAGIAGAAALLVVRYRRANRVVDILEGSRKSIEAGDPWTGAVLLAYRQLVEHLGDHGVEDTETGTPRTFAQHLVDIGFMDAEAAAALVSLFERARYAGEGELSKDDALRAREILSETIRSAKRSESIRERSVQT